MATLAEQRRAINQGMLNSRAATGGAERKAIEKNIEAERRGKSVVDDLGRLAQPSQQRRSLRPVQPVGALPTARGRGVYVAPPAASTGGGIASPLTETDYALREFHATRFVISADGVFVWEFQPVSKITMADANGATVEQIFASPPNG